MTVVVALILAFMSTGLKDIHKKNEAIYNKKAILGAIAESAGLDMSSVSDDDVLDIFSNKIEQVVVDASGKVVSKEEVEKRGYIGGMAENIDMKNEAKKDPKDRLLPFYIYKGDNGKLYIITIRGKGLWDEIWANVAIKDDLNTIAGIAFDHAGETPGLGAEIKDNPSFYNQFKGKKLFTDKGEYVSVAVIKGGAKNPVHEVDAISGATLTSNGVSNMMKKGISMYLPYFKTLKK